MHFSKITAVVVLVACLLLLDVSGASQGAPEASSNKTSIHMPKHHGVSSFFNMFRNNKSANHNFSAKSDHVVSSREVNGTTSRGAAGNDLKKPSTEKPVTVTPVKIITASARNFNATSSGNVAAVNHTTTPRTVPAGLAVFRANNVTAAASVVPTTKVTSNSTIPKTTRGIEISNVTLNGNVKTGNVTRTNSTKPSRF